MMLRSLLRALSHPRVFFFCCIWLIVLLTVGTIAQRDLGLYLAQEKYFSSWFLFVGFLPLPGGRLTMLLTFINLALFHTKKTLWRPKKIGVLITHFGALLLLVGGFLTAYFSSEGTMVINEGETVSFVSSDEVKELVLADQNHPDYDEITAIPEALLKVGSTLTHPNIPGSFEVLEYYRNCRPVPRKNQDSGPYRGLAERFELERIPEAQERQQNRAGIVLKVSGIDEQNDGIYALYERSPMLQTLSDGQRTVALVLRRERTYLPFSLELLDFQQNLHPGTGMAKSYRSIVNLHQGETSRRVVIQMNEPLRLAGRTFFQASFFKGNNTETTVLQVVKNYGRMFPYISSIIMCIGLLIHLVIKVPGLIAKKKSESNA